jgi:hypothetical protein
MVAGLTYLLFCSSTSSKRGPSRASTLTMLVSAAGGEGGSAAACSICPSTL